MSELPWFRFFPSDWLGGTRGMSASETGVYISLLAMMYERGSPLAVDIPRLARLCGASPASFKRALKALESDHKIIRKDDGLWNDRVKKELVYRAQKSDVARRAAVSRWAENSNENNAGPNADAMRGQCAGNAIPEARSQKPDSPTAKADRGGEEPPHHSESFETFWSGYPMTEGVSRRKAETEWQALSPDERIAAIAALPRFAVIQAKRDAPFCPAPAKWLAEKRFETVLPEKPQSVTALRTVELTDSAEHKFLSECRNDRATGWDYWISGGFEIVEFNGQTVCVVSRRIDEFCAALRPTAKRLGYLIWPDAFYQKQLEKAVA
jgi:uncharacterized protein YdaU (DUF1376 family)